MTSANTDMAGLFWGCLWRAICNGVLLGAGFGGFYVATFGTLLFPVVGTAYGFSSGRLRVS